MTETPIGGLPVNEELCPKCGRVTPSKVVHHGSGVEFLCSVCGTQTDFLIAEDEVDPLGDDHCHHCGAPYDGGHRCGSCGNGDPLDEGEFDPVSGEQW